MGTEDHREDPITQDPKEKPLKLKTLTGVGKGPDLLI